MNVLKKKENVLFLVLSCFFICNALLAEFIGVKIFSLEHTIGIEPLTWQLFGQSLQFDMTAGVLLWPVVFIMTDVINEYFGKRGVRFLSYMAAVLIAFSFVVVYGAMALKPADWWPSSAKLAGVENMQLAFAKIFGQGLWIIMGSLVAFLIGQLLDVFVFQQIKKITGESKVWLRATGSTLISQFVDSFVVLLIAFHLGAGWKLSQVLAIGFNNYIYKFLVAIVLTPFIYLAHYLIDRYLGKEKAHRMKLEAIGEN